ncbi:hypothetical protein V6N13_142983 [Hibiscus sabdariffa]|uniref:Uncharacterized protein n=1 Tax=Hibiscus sabdariffa TaxID=183260 RepID=A0ABR2FFZ6_9ROSI
MAPSNTTLLISSLLFFFFFFFSCLSLSSARLLDGNPSASRSTLSLALHNDPKSTALPCDHMVPFKNLQVGVPTEKLGRRYGIGPMFLSMLPKGEQVPSSGPSKGSNHIKT